MLEASRDVISIEYVTGASEVADVHTPATRDGIRTYVGHMDLDGIDLEGLVQDRVAEPVVVVPPPDGRIVPFVAEHPVVGVLHPVVTGGG